MGAALPIMMGINAVSEIYKGVQARNAANEEASMLEQQGNIQLQESRTEAGLISAEAQRRAKEIRKFAARQKLQYLKNGVTLEGSPLHVLDETFEEGQKEVNLVRQKAQFRLLQGNSLYTLQNQKAQQQRNQGRAAFIGGFLNAASGTASTYAQSKGLLGNA